MGSTEASCLRQEDGVDAAGCGVVVVGADYLEPDLQQSAIASSASQINESAPGPSRPRRRRSIAFGMTSRLSNDATQSRLSPCSAPSGMQVGSCRIVVVTGATVMASRTAMERSRVTISAGRALPERVSLKSHRSPWRISCLRKRSVGSGLPGSLRRRFVLGPRLCILTQPAVFTDGRPPRRHQHHGSTRLSERLHDCRDARVLSSNSSAEAIDDAAHAWLRAAVATHRPRGRRRPCALFGASLAFECREWLASALARLPSRGTQLQTVR